MSPTDLQRRLRERRHANTLNECLRVLASVGIDASAADALPLNEVDLVWSRYRDELRAQSSETRRYPEGDAAVQYGGNTTCSRYVKMNGTAELILNGGGTVASNSFSHLLALSGSAYGLIASSPGTTYFIKYTTTVWAPIGFSWTTVPPQCTVSAPKITCTMLTPFTVN